MTIGPLIEEGLSGQAKREDFQQRFDQACPQVATTLDSLIELLGIDAYWLHELKTLRPGWHIDVFHKHLIDAVGKWEPDAVIAWGNQAQHLFDTLKAAYGVLPAGPLDLMVRDGRCGFYKPQPHMIKIRRPKQISILEYPLPNTVFDTTPNAVFDTTDLSQDWEDVWVEAPTHDQ